MLILEKFVVASLLFDMARLTTIATTSSDCH